MSSLIRRQPQIPGPAIVRDRSLNAEVAAAEHDGIAAVARLHAGAYVGFVGLQNVEMLSSAANAAYKRAPLSEDLYQAIVMAYATLVIGEVQGLGLRGGSH